MLGIKQVRNQLALFSPVWFSTVDRNVLRKGTHLVVLVLKGEGSVMNYFITADDDAHCYDA